MAEVSIWHVTGDAGFADAGSLGYLVRVSTRDGARRFVEYRETYPHPFERNVFEPLRVRGLSTRIEVLEGPMQGLGGCVLYAAALLWLVTAAAVGSFFAGPPG